MSTPDWKLVKELFHEAIRLDTSARVRYLDEVCKNNDALRTEIESLLNSVTAADGFLEKPAIGDGIALNSGNRLKPGESVSHYKIVSHIATGGMGEVYLAEDQNLPRKVAVKVLPQSMIANDQIGRFQREANSASALNHPNILTIHDFQSLDGFHILVSEFVEGQTLREKLKSSGLTVGESLDVAIQIMSALEAAHNVGIIHRDIKPENIMIRNDGYVKILDFGLAKLTESISTDENAQTLLQVVSNAGMIMGTTKYMSPEQARGQRVDHRTDIFSFGIVLYEMLTGRPPFIGDTSADVIAAILQTEPPPPSSARTGCPIEFDTLLMRALSKDLAKRYQTSGELSADLRALARTYDSSAEVAGTKKPTVSEMFLRSSSGAKKQSGQYERDGLIGRDTEIEEVVSLLRKNDVRLVTLTGIGGTGKTRLSCAVAERISHEFPGGTAFVELSCIRDPELVTAAIAQTLGIPEIGGSDVLGTIKKELKGKPVLLVLDNLEQVIAAAPQIAEFLSDLPGTKILATSRELLHLSIETEYPVPPLALPSELNEPSPETLRQFESVALFEKRARQTNPEFEMTEENAATVAEICTKLDGLPLAIELAAARTRILTPAEILSKLDDRLSLLTGGAKDLPDRQRTVRGAIEWSYDLLTDPEKDLFARLSVFAGGFTTSTAESVISRSDGGCNNGLDLSDRSIEFLDLLTSLLDKSLIVRKLSPNGNRRFAMLNTVREYASAVLSSSGNAAAMHRCHAQYFLELAEAAKPHLKAAESPRWLRRLEDEHENLRAALRWSIENEPDIAAHLAAAIRHLWTIHGHLHEGRTWSAEILSRNTTMPDSIRWEILTGYGNLSQFQGDLEKAQALYAESLAVSKRGGDKKQISQSLRGLAALAYMQSDFATARDFIEQAIKLSRESNDEFGLAASLGRLGDIASAEGNYAESVALTGEALRIFRVFEYKEGISAKLNNLGAVLFELGSFDEARQHFDEALAVAIELGEKINTRLIFDGYGALAAESGDFHLAARFSGVAETLGASIGYAPEPAETRFRSAYIAKVRSELGDNDYNTAYSEGLKLGIDEAIRLAMGDDGAASGEQATTA